MRRHTTPMNMTEGRPLALLSVFALPLLIGNLFQQAYNLADSMIVGQILGARNDRMVCKSIANSAYIMLAGLTCLLRYFSWRRKLGKSGPPTMPEQ